MLSQGGLVEPNKTDDLVEPVGVGIFVDLEVFLGFLFPLRILGEYLLLR